MSGLLVEILLGLAGLAGVFGFIVNTKRKAKKRGVEETTRKAKEADYEKAYIIRKRNAASGMRRPDAGVDKRGNRD